MRQGMLLRAGMTVGKFIEAMKRLRTKLTVKDVRDIITDVSTFRKGKFTITVMTGKNTCTGDVVESIGIAIKNPNDKDDPELGKQISQGRALTAFKSRAFYRPITKRFMG